jgi:hypothetical protein
MIAMLNKVRPPHHGLLTFISAIVLVSSPLHAQTAPLLPLAGFEPHPGITLGDYALYGRVQTGITPTSNVRLDPTEQEDIRRLLTADLSLRSNWKRNQVVLTGSYFNQTAVETPDQENNLLSGTASGRLDLTKEVNVTLGALHIESTIGKNDPNQFNGLLNGENYEDTLEAGLNWDDRSSFVSLLYRHQDITSLTQVELTGESEEINQNQDRVEQNFTLQYGRHVSWGKYYVLGGVQGVTYAGNIVYEDRNSFGGRAGIGIEYSDENWTAILRLNVFSQKFEDDELGRVNALVGTAQASLKLNDRWSLGGVLQRQFDETNITGSGGIFTNLAGVGFQYQPVDNFYVKTGPTFRYYQIQGTPYTAQSISLDTTAAWQIDKQIELLLTSTLSDQTCNDAYLEDLDNNNVYSDFETNFSLVFTF